MDLFRQQILYCTILLSAAGCSLKPSPVLILRSWGVDAPANEELKLVHWQSASGSPGPNSAVVARAENGEELRAENFKTAGAEQAESYLRVRLEAIARIYDTRPEPYQGTITRSIECPQEFKPSIQENSDGADRRLEIDLFANANGVFGACNSDNAKFHVHVTALYCDSDKRLSWIEYLRPIKSEGPPGPRALCRDRWPLTASSILGYFQLLFGMIQSHA